MNRASSMKRSYWLLILIVACVSALNFVFIPLHSGDDEDHFARAWALAHGGILPKQSNIIDPAFSDYAADRHDAVRLRAKIRPADRVWTGKKVAGHLNGIPIGAYLPAVYAPQAVAILIGESAGFSIEQTILLSRFANGLTALALITLAIGLLPGAVEQFFLLLLCLPKTLLLFGSNAADPLLIAGAFFIAAWSWRIANEATPRRWLWPCMGLVLIFIAGARPPLIVWAALPLYVAAMRKDLFGATIMAGAVAASLVWWGMAPSLQDVRCPGGATIPGLLADAPGLAFHTLSHNGLYYLQSLIGELGYGDGPNGWTMALPGWVYAIGFIVLMLGLAHVLCEDVPIPKLQRAIILITGLVAAGGVFFTVAVACGTREGAIAGVQGRYLLLPLFLLASGLGHVLRPMPMVSRLIPILLPIFLLASTFVLVTEGMRVYAGA